MPNEPIDVTEPFQMIGVALTQAGRELMEIVEMKPAENYTLKLIQYLRSKKLEPIKVRPIPGSDRNLPRYALVGP